MRGLIISFALCIIASMQVESYIVTVDTFVLTYFENPFTVETLNETDYDDEFKYEDVYDYMVRFNNSNGELTDIALEYFYVDENNNLIVEGKTSLCNADFSNPDGTVAAFVATALGIKESPVCPRQEMEFTQKSVFALEEGDFSNLPDSTDEYDSLFVKLEVYSPSLMTMKLSITDDNFWFGFDEMEDPDENSNDGSSENEDSQTESEKDE